MLKVKWFLLVSDPVSLCKFFSFLCMRKLFLFSVIFITNKFKLDKCMARNDFIHWSAHRAFIYVSVMWNEIRLKFYTSVVIKIKIIHKNKSG